MHRAFRRVALLAAALAFVVVSGACSPREDTALDTVNALRGQHGLPALAWNDGAHDKAVAWSSHMAAQGKLSHSNLADGVPPGWRTLGENVAMAGSLEQAMAALEASSPHRANMLNTAFTSVAIGVVERDGLVWVTEVFVG